MSSHMNDPTSEPSAKRLRGDSATPPPLSAQDQGERGQTQGSSPFQPGQHPLTTAVPPHASSLNDPDAVDESLLAELISTEQHQWDEQTSALYQPRHVANASINTDSQLMTPSISLTPHDDQHRAAEQPTLRGEVIHHSDDATRRRLSWSVIRGVRPLTLASDLAACALATAIAQPNLLRAAVFTAVLVVLFANSKLYRSRLTLSALDDLPRIFLGWLGATAITMSAAAFVHDRLGTPGLWSNPRTILTSVSFIALPLIVLGRMVCYAVIRRARAQRRVGHRTLIVGAGTVGQRMVKILRDHPEYGLNPYCFLDDNVAEHTTIEGLPVLGSSTDLSEILMDNSIHIVIVAFSHMKEQNMVGLIRTCDRLDSELFVVPRLYELHQVEGDMDSIWGVPLIRLRRAAYRSMTWPLKRLFDILCSGAALVVLGIPMAIIALAVRLDGGPGVIFRQDRVGVDGRHVEVMKFRSMKPADKNEAQTQWNIANDNRVTPLGRFLRKTSLDELPQLLNILRGDMSIVGPRPERPHFVSQFQERYPAYNARHRVPCGLTGLAAVSGLRGDTSIEDRARFDNYYIQNWSLWLDIKIILRTVSSVVTGAGG